MAQKIKLGARPKTFARTVTFPMPGEEMGSIEVKFRYRSRSEFAEFVDNLQAEAKAAGDEEISRLRSAIEAGSEVTNPTQAEIVARQNAANVRYLLDAVEGWNLDIPLDKEAAEQLADELPAAVNAILNDYRSALVEGRLGN